MNRATIAAFVVCQGVGELAEYLWPRLPGALAPFGWISSIVLLLPGDLAAQWMIERFVWTSSSSLTQLQAIKSIVEIIVNAAAWLLAGVIFARLSRRPSRGSAP